MNEWYDNLGEPWRFLVILAIVMGALLIGMLVAIIAVRVVPRMTRKRPIYVKMTDTDFAVMIHGDVVRLTSVNGKPVEMILDDIGFDRMLDHINDAAIKQ